MKWLFRFILSHSFFIALCAAALSLQTLQLLLVPVNYYLLAFIFFATLAGYNAYWIVSKFSFNPPAPFISLLQKNISAVVVIVAAITGMLFCITHLRLVLYNIIITSILLVLYAIPVIPFKRLHFTRKAGFLKTVLLAFTWSFVTTLIPLQISMLSLSRATFLVFLTRFLFMLMLCIIFDKRDAVVDKIRGLQSLATDIRPWLLHCLIGMIFIFYTCASYSLITVGITVLQVSALIITGLTTLIFYICSLQKRGYFFYYFLVDGLMFLSALLTGLAGS